MAPRCETQREAGRQYLGKRYRPREEMPEAGLAQCPERLPGGCSAGLQGWWQRKTEVAGAFQGPGGQGASEFCSGLDFTLHRHFQLDALVFPFLANSRAFSLVWGK